MDRGYDPGRTSGRFEFLIDRPALYLPLGQPEK